MGQRANVNHLCGRSGARCVIASLNAPVGLGYSRVLGENPSDVWSLVWRTNANRFSSVCNAAKNVTVYLLEPLRSAVELDELSGCPRG